MQKTYKGGALPLVLVVVVLVIAASVFLFGRGTGNVGDVAKNAASGVVEVAKDKGTEMIEEGKDKAIDVATEEGKKVVGGVLKDAGEKMTEEAGEPGIYEDYSAEQIAANDGAILDFSATWCPSCRAFEKNLTANLDKIPHGVAILKVDYDTSGDLKKKYGVTQQHTFVQVDKDGGIIKKWVGSPTIDHVVASMEA